MALRLTKLLTLAVSAGMLLSACLRMPPTENPIGRIGELDTKPAGKTLIVMLPGRGDRAQAFAGNGFLDISRQHGFDTVAVDAHFGYYMKRSLLPRLHEDIIAPARADGYERIWLLGISMGGFGAVLYAQAHPDQVDGLILIAPYLGSDEIVADVRAARSLAEWRSSGKGFPAHEVSVWRWLQQAAAEPDGIPVLLGYGLADRLAVAYEPLLPELDASRLYTRDGNHKWTTWTPLWETIAAELEN
jgi:pimeloyl-ACP methyl ester carboxylesterase